MEILEKLVEEAAEILASRNAADRTGQDVVKHQGRNGEFGEAAAERLFYGAIDTAADEHTAAFDVHRADGVRKDHDVDNEPGSGLADVAFGFATRVIGGRSEVIENDCSCFPEGNEGEKRSSRDYDARNCVAAPTLGGRALGNRAHVWVIRFACEQAADINARKFEGGSLVEGE